MKAAHSGENHGKTASQELLAGLQSEGGFSSREGGEDARRIGATVRRSPQSGHAMEGPASRRRRGGVRRRRRSARSSRRREEPPRQDRRTDFGKRFLRNGSTTDGRRLNWLKDKAECLGAPMQIFDHPLTVSDVVERRTRVDIFHTVTHGVVEQ